MSSRGSLRQHNEIGPTTRRQRPDLVLHTQAAGGINRGRAQDLDGAQPGLRHEVHLHVLEVALEATGRAGVGAESDGKAGVGYALEIPLCHPERLFVTLCGRAVPNSLLASRISSCPRTGWVGVLQEERVVEEVGSVLVDVGGHLSRQRRRVAGAAVAQELDELVVHVEVPHGVGDEVRSRPEQGLGILQVEEMRRQPQPESMGPLDDGAEHVGGHLAGRAQVVVDSDLHPIHAGLGVGVHHLQRPFSVSPVTTTPAT